jgi:hypothetical protein
MRRSVFPMGRALPENLMAGRKKKTALVIQTEKIKKTEPKDITPDQYEKGFSMWLARSPMPQIMAATGMTRKQLLFLASNHLPDFEDECPSYNMRLAQHSATINARAIKSSERISEDAPKALEGMSEIALISQTMVKFLLGSHINDLRMNQQLPPEQRKSRRELLPSKPELDTLKMLEKYANYTSVADAFRRVYESPYQRLDPVSGMDKDVKIDLSADMALPASVATMVEVQEQQEQDEDDFHHRLFRDFTNWSEKELERYLRFGELPEREYINHAEESTD